MNVQEINPQGKGTLVQYVALSLPLTLVTTWVIMAFQSKYIFPPGTSFIMRLGWPLVFINMILKKRQPLVGKHKPDYSIGDRHGV